MSTTETDVAEDLKIEIVTNFGEDTEGGLPKFYGALAKAQGAFTAIVKNQTARIKSKREGGADYSYKYADMDAIREATTPALSGNGIASVFYPVQKRDGGHWLRGRLMHEGGGWMVADVYIPPIPPGSMLSETIKTFGGVVSYLRRYLKIAMLDLSAGDDAEDDGGGHRLDGGGYTPTRGGEIIVHNGMKTAKSIAELTRIMRELDKADRIRYQPYFNVREQELQEGMGP